MIWEMYPAEEIDAACICPHEYLIRMQRQLEVLRQKLRNFRQQLNQRGTIIRQNDKIVCVANETLYFQIVFYELIKLIHIDIHKQLRC